MKKILIIEDNEDVRENIAEILELSNYEVISAVNGVDGVKLAEAQIPDLILCDVMMPELDGFGVLKILNEKPHTQNIPFLFLTAKAEMRDLRRGMNLGADDYITKPFDDVELLEAIEVRLIKQARLLQAHKQMSAVPAGSPHLMEFQSIEKKLIEFGELRKYDKRRIIFYEGDNLMHVHFINKGVVKLYQINDLGREVIFEMMGSGSFFGYENLLRNNSQPFFAETIEGTEVHSIPRKKFEEFLQDNPVAWKYFMKLTTQRLFKAYLNINRNHSFSVRKRTAEILCELSEIFGANKFQIKRDDFANYAGTAKETIIRNLSDLKEEGLIEVRGSEIKLMNKKALKEVIN